MWQIINKREANESDCEGENQPEPEFYFHPKLLKAIKKEERENCKARIEEIICLFVDIVILFFLIFLKIIYLG